MNFKDLVESKETNVAKAAIVGKRIAEKAKAAGVSVSIDLNFRGKLWNWDTSKTARTLEYLCDELNKAIYQINNFNSIVEASNSINCSASLIGWGIKQNKLAKGFYWKYDNEDLINEIICKSFEVEA